MTAWTYPGNEMSSRLASRLCRSALAMLVAALVVLFVAQPLPIVGGTGSPLAPIAVL